MGAYLPNIFFVTGQEKVRNQAEGNWVEPYKKPLRGSSGKSGIVSSGKSDRENEKTIAHSRLSSHSLSGNRISAKQKRELVKGF